MPSALVSTRRVLKREEERILFTLIGACTSAGVAYQVPAGSSLEASSVALAAARGCSRADAGHTLILAQRAHALLLKFNVRLVAHVAKRYADSGVELAELVSEGLVGVEQALAKFDLSRGCKFSSLAMFYIRRECQRCVANQGRVLRLPCHVYSRLQQIMHVRTQLLEAGDAAAEHLRRNPALLHAKIGDALDLEPGVVAATLRAGVAPRELDAVAWRDSDNDDTLLEGLAEADVWDGVKETSQRQVVEASLNAVLQTLEPRERNVLRLRYGLNSERRCVARVEIAEAYGLSGERIRQIEEIAVQKLMKPWRRQFLKDFGAGIL